MKPRVERLSERLSRTIGPHAMERLVDPILSDIRIERRLAIRQRRVWKSRWVLVAGGVSLVTALTIHGWLQLSAFERWPSEDRRAWARTLIYFATISTAAMAFLIVPPLWPRVSNAAEPPLALIAYLTPQAIPIALPIGLLLGLLYGFRGTVLGLRSTSAVLILAAVCSLSSFVTLAWIVPDANQRFRVAVSRNLISRHPDRALRPELQVLDRVGDSHIPRGMNELTLGELGARIAAERHAGGDTRIIAMNYHTRWALGAAPAVVAMWALLVIGFGVSRRWMISLAGITTSAGYVGFQTLGRVGALHGVVSPAVGAWLPNIALSLTALLLARLIRSPRLRTMNVER